MAFIPGFLSGFAILMEHHSRRGIVISTYINMTLEYIVRHLEARGIINRTREKDIFMFMISSGVLMYLLRKCHRHTSKAAQLWFFVPLPPNHKDADSKKAKGNRLQSDAKHNTSVSSHICPHSGTCLKHAVKVSGKIFFIGIGLEVIHYLTSHTRKPQDPWTTSTAILNSKTFLISGFLGGYVAIFQVVSCLLNQYRGHDSEMHSMLAGFLAGATYCLHPNITITLSALTTILQVLAMEISRRGLIPHPKKVAAVIFALCNATLFHGKMMESNLCPHLISTLMSISSDRKVDLMQKEAQKIIQSIV